MNDDTPTFPFRSVLAVCAHPDDESFGLGAVLSTFAALGIATSVLCFTHGEASTLGSRGADLATVRAEELAAAAEVLGISSVRLQSYADGALPDVPFERLCHDVETSVVTGSIECLLAFDDGGITGHPDHQRATDAARAVAERLALPVLAWALPESVASGLNREFGTRFVGRDSTEIDYVIDVDRTLQFEAIACHTSQATDNPVLLRRLALLAGRECLRWLRSP